MLLPKTSAEMTSFTSSERFRFTVVMGFALAVGVVSWMVLPNGGIDMRNDILPSLWNWKLPWEEGTPLFPWATLVLMPLRLFSARFATSSLNFISVILVALLIRRYGGNILLAIPVMLSPFGYKLFTTGQTDALVLASIFLPAGLDLLLFWKPQVIAHIYWSRVYEKPKIYFLSGAALLAVSWLLWGEWPLAIWKFGSTQLIGGWWDYSVWPYGIPVGILMAYLSFKKRDDGYGIIASPLLFPYVNGPSYVGLISVVAAKWPKIFWACNLLFLLYLIFAVNFSDLHLPLVY